MEQESPKFYYRAYFPGPRSIKSIIKIIAILILLAGLLYLGVVAYYWATSEEGKKKISHAFEGMKRYLFWYSEQLERAKKIGESGWGTELNKSSTIRGLVFKDFKLVGSKRIPPGTPITLKYEIELKNYEKEIFPQFYCSMPYEDIKGEIIPKNPIISPYGRTNVRCLISKTENLSGKEEIVGGFTFPIEQEAKIDVFITTSRIFERLKGEDFFRHFGIDVSKPIRVTYNGEPIEISIGVTDTEQPVIIGEGYTPFVGIILRNMWDGKLINITEIRLYLPDGIEIDSELSKNPSVVCPFVKTSQLRGFTEYVAPNDILESLKFEGGKEVINFECFLKIPENIVVGPYLKKMYIVKASYVYGPKEKKEYVTIEK